MIKFMEKMKNVNIDFSFIIASTGLLILNIMIVRGMTYMFEDQGAMCWQMLKRNFGISLLV